MKDIFSGYRIFGWYSISLNSLHMSSGCLLSSMISAANSAVDLTEETLYMMTKLFLTALKIHSLQMAWGEWAQSEVKL